MMGAASGWARCLKGTGVVAAYATRRGLCLSPTGDKEVVSMDRSVCCCALCTCGQKLQSIKACLFFLLLAHVVGLLGTTHHSSPFPPCDQGGGLAHLLARLSHITHVMMCNHFQSFRTLVLLAEWPACARLSCLLVPRLLMQRCPVML